MRTVVKNRFHQVVHCHWHSQGRDPDDSNRYRQRKKLPQFFSSIESIESETRPLFSRTLDFEKSKFYFSSARVKNEKRIELERDCCWKSLKIAWYFMANQRCSQHVWIQVDPIVEFDEEKRKYVGAWYTREKALEAFVTVLRSFSTRKPILKWKRVRWDAGCERDIAIAFNRNGQRLLVQVCA